MYPEVNCVLLLILFVNNVEKGLLHSIDNEKRVMRILLQNFRFFVGTGFVKEYHRKILALLKIRW